MNSQPHQTDKVWFAVIKRKGQPVLFNSLVLTGFQDPYYREVLLLPRGIHCLKYIDGLVILEKGDADVFAGQLAQHLTPHYLQFFIAKCHSQSDILLRTAGDLRSQGPYDSFTNPELTVLLTTYSSAVIRVMTFLTTIVVLEGVLQSSLEDKLQSHCQSQEIALDPKAFLNTLIMPKEKNLPSKALTELYELGATVNANHSLLFALTGSATDLWEGLGKSFPDFRKSCEDYLDRYDFMNMEYYVGRPLAPAELLARVKDVTPHAERRLQRIEEDNYQTQVEIDAALEKLKLSPELLALVDAARRIHYLRQYRADSLFKAGRDALELLTTIAERLELAYDELIFLTHDEIADSIVRGELVVGKEEIEVRRERYAIAWVDQERSVVTGAAVDEELATLAAIKEEVSEEIREIRGDIAFHGKYQGPVAVVTQHDEVEKVKPGDVLVSPMTDPYFVPAMVRAGAIVTDEGGILSHAAIVSRELGIPCIVGTRNATSVLRDGITVEVDASGEWGIVHVLREVA